MSTAEMSTAGMTRSIGSTHVMGSARPPRGSGLADPVDEIVGWLDDPGERLELILARDDGGWDRVAGPDLVRGIRWLSRRFTDALGGPDAAPDQPVAVLAHSGLTTVASFWAALDCGAALVPLAPPGIGDASEIVERVAGILRAAGAPLIVATPDVAETARAAVAHCGGDVTVLVVSDEEVLAASGPECDDDDTRGAPADRGRLALVQFTSGSTGSPRGVPVTWESLAHNTGAIEQHFGLRPDDSFASWVPLHHDMGLVGVLLTAFPAGCPLTLMRPDQFLRSPRRWLEAMTWSTLSAAPSFGLGYVARRVKPESVADLDLSRWRGTALGSEPLRLRDVGPFLELTEQLGLPRTNLIPAYGLAESTLLACAGRSGERLRAIRLATPPRPGVPVDVAEVWDGLGPVPREGVDGRWSIDLGRPDADTHFEVLGPDGSAVPEGCFGEVAMRSPSLSAGYRHSGAGADPHAASAAADDHFEGRTRFANDGRLLTGDGGVILGGRLHVLGRLGTSVTVAGRTVLMEDIDAAVSSALGIPGGRLAAVSFTEFDPPVVALIVESDDPEVDPLRRVVRSVVGDAAGVAVVTAPRGAVSRTSSGKPRRRALAARLRDGLPEGWHWHGDGLSSDAAGPRAVITDVEMTGSRDSGHLTAEADILEVFEAVRDEVSVPVGAAVLHEGSLAEGFGNARSDVDFLVVVPGSAATPTMPTVLFSRGRRVEVRTRSVAQVRAQFDAVAEHLLPDRTPSVDSPGDDLLNRCQRLLGARIVVDSPALAEAAPPDRSAFAALTADWWRVRGRHCMARSVASAILLGEDGPGSDADGWAREGVLQLAKAWLALRGETYIESKWTDLQLARVEQTGGPDADLAARCRSSLGAARDPEGWTSLARALDAGSVPEAGSLVVVREPGVTTWMIGDRVHVLHPAGAVAVFDGPAAGHWRSMVPGRGLDDHLRCDPGIGPALIECVDAGLIGFGLVPAVPTGSLVRVEPAIAMCSAAEPSFPTVAPAQTMVRLDGATPPPTADGGDEVPWFAPLTGARFASCGLGLVWANIVLENAREDLDGAIRDSQWGVASAAARRQIATAVRALLSASGIYPLPADTDPARDIRRLCAPTAEIRAIADEVAALWAEPTSPERMAADPEAARNRLETLTHRIRVIACGEDFPSSFDGGAQWGRTIGIAYDWLRIGAHLDSRIPLDEARDLLETGGRQPHEEVHGDDD